MKHEFKVGDHVEWNSEVGHVRASKEEPQYLIKSDKTEHMAMHKGTALKRISKSDSQSQKLLAHSKKK
jgi:hypothetical protein